jgi:hypothetical protein
MRHTSKRQPKSKNRLKFRQCVFAKSFDLVQAIAALQVEESPHQSIPQKAMTQVIQFPKFTDDMKVNFGTQFPHDPSKGRDYSTPISTLPEPLIISVPKDGWTDNEFLVYQRQQQNIRNAINGATELYQTHEANARLHATAAKAQGAAINAATEWQGVRQAHATHRSATDAANYAELKADVDREKYMVQGKTLFVELKQAQVTLSKATLDLLQAGFDLITHRTVRGLNGVPVDEAPELQYENLVKELPPASFESTIDLSQFLKSRQQASQNVEAQPA